MPYPVSRRVACLAATALLFPSLAAAAERLTPVLVFQNAAPLPKLIVLALVVATVAAVVVCVRKLRSGPRLAGGSAFVSGLRLGGPLFGCLGGAYALLNMSLGLANVPMTPPVQVLARGWAEAVLLLGLGFLAGAVAAVANWAIEARIDRAVLSPA